MKNLLNNYFVEKKKLETELEDRDADIEEIIIKDKFLEQENQRINRELIRWKERYEWLEKQKEAKVKQAQEDRNHIVKSFEEYKLNFNQGILNGQKNEFEEAMKKIEEYQRAY